VSNRIQRRIAKQEIKNMRHLQYSVDADFAHQRSGDTRTRDEIVIETLCCWWEYQRGWFGFETGDLILEKDA